MGQAMGQGTGLKPPKSAEFIAGLLIPPACRETVLGDLHERYTSLAQYVIEVAMVTPCVVVSRIRRTAEPAVLLMEAFLLYLSFIGAARYVDPVLLRDDTGLLRLAAPGIVALVGLLLADAYINPTHKSAIRPIASVAFGLILGLFQGFGLPRAVVYLGAVMSLLLLSALRLFFPPWADRPRGQS